MVVPCRYQPAGSPQPVNARCVGLAHPRGDARAHTLAHADCARVLTQKSPTASSNKGCRALLTKQEIAPFGINWRTACPTFAPSLTLMSKQFAECK